MHWLTSCFCGNRLRFPWVLRDYETSSWQSEENRINNILGQCSGPPSSDPVSSGFAAVLSVLEDKKTKQRNKKNLPLVVRSRCHSLLVHTASESFNVITNVSDHAVPLVSLRGLLALIWGSASSAGSVAVGGGVRGGAGCAPVTPEAVCNDASAIFHTNSLKEILKVLAVLLWYEGTQACRGTL